MSFVVSFPTIFSIGQAERYTEMVELHLIRRPPHRGRGPPFQRLGMTDVTPIQKIIAEIHAGRMAMLVEEDREGNLVFATELVTPDEDQLHGEIRSRADLFDVDRSVLQPSSPTADSERELAAAGDQFHHAHRGGDGYGHRHFHDRPRAHYPGGIGRTN